jgi:hypothetical protein
MSRPDNTYGNANDNEKDDGSAMTANDNNFGSKVIAHFGLAHSYLLIEYMAHAFKRTLRTPPQSKFFFQTISGTAIQNFDRDFLFLFLTTNTNLSRQARL